MSDSESNLSEEEEVKYFFSKNFKQIKIFIDF